MEPTPSAEADLLRRAGEGDLDAFEALYGSHVRRVFTICRRMTADVALAEELTQETFLRAWTRLRTVRPGSPLGPWLGRIAVNVVLNDRRSRMRRGGGEATGLASVEAAAPAPRRGEALDLERAIALLPPRARATFVLHDVEGFGHEEIAGLLGVTAGTSKAQLHRARRLLREALQP